jgi:site-specific recombinase XerD/ribosomal protein L40E
MPARADKPFWDIHKRQLKYERATEALAASSISDGNRQLILDFIRHKKIAEDIGISRQTKYLHYLRILGELLGKRFDEATAVDIEDLLEKAYGRPVQRGETIKEASVSTKRDLAVMLKTFYKWIKKKDNPEEVAWIKPMNVEHPFLGPDVLVSWDDIEKMAAVCLNVRDEAFLRALMESGCRIGELLSLRVSDLEPRGKAVVIRLRQSKTQLRKILLVRSAGYLIRWRNSHPHRDDPEYPLWIDMQRHKQLSYASASYILKRLAKRAGLRKHIHPHLFRKSSATYYARYLSPSELKARYGWKQSSKMLDIYLHMDDEDVNRHILQIEGVEDAEKPKEKLKSCLSCGTLNPSAAENCCLCNELLDEGKYYRQKQVMGIIDSLIQEKAGGYEKLFGEATTKPIQ